eukprot:54875-Lingulodinium_polyedra.AAC.1
MSFACACVRVGIWKFCLFVVASIDQVPLCHAKSDGPYASGPRGLSRRCAIRPRASRELWSLLKEASCVGV